MNLVYYQDNRRGSRDRWRSDKHRQDAHVLRASPTGGAASWSGRGWALIVQRERPRTPIRDSMEGNRFSPQLELDSGW